MPAPARKRSATLARPASESKPILAAVLALVGLFMLVAMITHSSNDRSWLGTQDTTVPVTDNYCGELGASIAVALFNLFGYAGFLIPFFVLAAAWFALNQRAHTLWPFKVTLMVLCVILFAPILTLWLGTSPDATAAFDPKGPGGLLGNILFTSVFHPYLDYGTWILVFPYGFCLLGALADDPKATLSSWIAEMRDGFGAWNAERKAAALKAAEEQRRRDVAAAELRRKQQEVVGAVMSVPQPKETAKPVSKSVPAVVDTPHEGPKEDEEAGPDLVQPDNVSISADAPKVEKAKPTPVADDDKDEDEAEVPEAKPPRKAPEPLGPNAGKVLVVQPDKIEKARASQVIKKRGDYVFPEIRMLNEPADNSKLEPEDFRKRASDLIDNAILKIYEGAPHGLTDTHKDQLNADLPEFLR